MKIREITLDFTSLLDVTMILLFFFVLFSTFEIDTATSEANESKQNYETLSAEIEAEHSEWEKKIQDEWDRISAVDKNAIGNQQALIDYNNGSVLTFNMQNDENSDIWSLSVVFEDRKIAEIRSDENVILSDKITEIISSLNITADTVIISTLTYDGNAYGTASAVQTVENAVKKVQREYQNFYFTSINISK